MTQGTKELTREKIANGLKRLATRLFDTINKELSDGNMAMAHGDLLNASAFLLRYEFYALKSGQEEDLKELKERYYDMSRRLGVKLE